MRSRMRRFCSASVPAGLGLLVQSVTSNPSGVKPSVRTVELRSSATAPRVDSSEVGAAALLEIHGNSLLHHANSRAGPLACAPSGSRGGQSKMGTHAWFRGRQSRRGSNQGWPVRQCRGTGIASIVLLAATGTVHAVPIFSNLGPSGQWGANGGNFGLIGESYAADLGQDLAMRFTVPALGPDYAFTGAELALINIVAPPSNSALSILLMEDANGLPGTILETMVLSSLLLPSSGALVSASSTTNPLLHAGITYWLAADAMGGLYDAWHPQYLSGPPTSGVFRRELEAGGETPWLFINDFSDGRDRGYRISGNALTSAPVPEPGTLGLVGVGLALFAGFRRRRRRALRLGCP